MEDYLPVVITVREFWACLSGIVLGGLVGFILGIISAGSEEDKTRKLWGEDKQDSGDT